MENNDFFIKIVNNEKVHYVFNCLPLVLSLTADCEFFFYISNQNPTLPPVLVVIDMYLILLI